MSASFAGCQEKTAGAVAKGDVDEPPRWHFETIEHNQGNMTFTDVWGRSDGALFVVGWYGAIITNRATPTNPEGHWKTMPSGTTEHLTGIWGVENGRDFGQERVDGEMFAVGWNGTLLHFHPNPSAVANPTPENGVWQTISEPGVGFTPYVKIDPFCPDSDGDGILDDGGGDPITGGPDGWWSCKDTCKSSGTNNCDDNCRSSPNGTMRPITDLDDDFENQTCLEWPDDGAFLPATCGGTCAGGEDCIDGYCGERAPQADPDADGVGTVCDREIGERDLDEFRPTLMDVWAMVYENTHVMVVAVGENGTVITYAGPNAAQTVAAPLLPITDRGAWIAQEQLAYFHSNDCPFQDPVGPGQNCQGRLAPRCPAQCNVYKTQCNCANGACCVSGDQDELTGAACQGPGCLSLVEDRTGLRADNACGALVAGECSDACPYCFFRLDKTLRAVTSDGSTVVAVGAGGTIVYLNLGGQLDPTEVWIRPDCASATPHPLDERPVLASVSQREGVFHAVGAGGAVVMIAPGSGCGLETRQGAPPAFLSGVFSLGQERGYAVGDSGVLLEYGGDIAVLCNPEPTTGECIDNGISENITALWVTGAGELRRLWLVGASGMLVKVGYY